MTKIMPKIEHYTTTLAKIFHLTPSVRTFQLAFPDGKGFAFQPGQFCMVEVPTEGKTKKKAYTICSSPDQKESLELCVKLVEGGLATNWFWTLQEGDAVNLGGPYGDFVLPDPVESDLIFVATGTGLTPFCSMLDSLAARDFENEVWLIFGVRHEDEILYHDKWLALEKKFSNFHYIPTISRPKSWDGEVGYVQEKLKKHITDPAGKQLYACGLVPMIEGVEQAALEIGFDKKQIHYEKYV